MRRGVVWLGTALLSATAAAAQVMPEHLNDYPTEARTDYVFGCMAANGQNREVLRKCACSIDVIASILPYEKYVEAETVLALQQGTGEQLAMYKTAVVSQTMVAELRRAQAEAEILCF